jgi:methionine synthase I (cobalamin-dependent)
MDKLISFLEQYPYVLGDRRIGTMLQSAGLVTQVIRKWNISHPEPIRAISQAYEEAGRR